MKYKITTRKPLAQENPPKAEVQPVKQEAAKSKAKKK